MTKVVILPLSLYMNNQQQKTKKAFLRLGVNRFSMIWHFFPFTFLDFFRGPSLPAIFDQYRSGEFTTEVFRNKIREKFPTVQLNDATFDEAWNAMQEVTLLTKKALNEASSLVERGITVYLISGTNELHINDIKRQYGGELPGIPFFSYQQKKLGRDLFSSLLTKIRKDNPGIIASDIAFFYTPLPRDPYSWLGPLAWLIDPIKRFEYSQAQQYVANLEREAASANGFTLIPCNPKEENEPSILSSIAALNRKEKGGIALAPQSRRLTYSYDGPSSSTLPPPPLLDEGLKKRAGNRL